MSYTLRDDVQVSIEVAHAHLDYRAEDEGYDVALTNEERARLLFDVKQLCIALRLPRPAWWYAQRNRTEWMTERDEPRYPGIHLGGF